MEKSDIECISAQQPRVVVRSTVRKEPISLPLGGCQSKWRQKVLAKICEDEVKFEKSAKTFGTH